MKSVYDKRPNLLAHAHTYPHMQFGTLTGFPREELLNIKSKSHYQMLKPSYTPICRIKKNHD